MKIAFIGAQGVGKTSLSRAFQEKFPDSIIVRETVRECPYPCDQDADFKTEWWVLSHSILAEQEVREKKAPMTITDRCLLDIAVYTKLINQAKNGRITDLQRQMIEDSISYWLKEDPFQHVFFLKVDPEIWQNRDLDDGFRSLDLSWYKTLTREFEEAIEKFGISRLSKLHVIQNDGNFQATLQKIVSLVGLK